MRRAPRPASEGTAGKPASTFIVVLTPPGPPFSLLHIGRGLRCRAIDPLSEGMKFIPFLTTEFDRLDVLHAIDGAFNAALGLSVLGLFIAQYLL